MKRIALILLTGFFLILTPSIKAQKDSVKDELNQTNDWPNLRRYRSENSKLTAPSANENRVVFMGN